MGVKQRLERLRAAGMPIGYADPVRAHEEGYVAHWAFREGSSWHYSDGRPFVELVNVKGDDAYGQSSTVERSNFRSLQRDFPGVFLPVTYSNVDTLGAFVHSLTDGQLDLIIGLANGYPLYDECDMSALESEEIGEAWEQYLRADTDLGEEWEQVADLFTDAEFRAAFYVAMSDADYYPEHDGFNIRWQDSHVEACMIAALCDLVSEFLGPLQVETLV